MLTDISVRIVTFSQVFCCAVYNRVFKGFPSVLLEPPSQCSHCSSCVHPVSSRLEPEDSSPPDLSGLPFMGRAAQGSGRSSGAQPALQGTVQFPATQSTGRLIAYMWKMDRHTIVTYVETPVTPVTALQINIFSALVEPSPCHDFSILDLLQMFKPKILFFIQPDYFFCNQIKN